MVAELHQRSYGSATAGDDGAHAQSQEQRTMRAQQQRMSPSYGAGPVSPVPMQWGGHGNEYDAQGFAMQPGAYEQFLAGQYQQQQAGMRSTMSYNYGNVGAAGNGVMQYGQPHMANAYEEPQYGQQGWPMQDAQMQRGYFHAMGAGARPAQMRGEERRAVPRDRDGNPIAEFSAVAEETDTYGASAYGGPTCGTSTSGMATASRPTSGEARATALKKDEETEEDEEEDKEMKMLMKMMRAMGETFGERQSELMNKMVETMTTHKASSKNVLTAPEVDDLKTDLEPKRILAWANKFAAGIEGKIPGVEAILALPVGETTPGGYYHEMIKSDDGAGTAQGGRAGVRTGPREPIGLHVQVGERGQAREVAGVRDEPAQLAGASEGPEMNEERRVDTSARRAEHTACDATAAGGERGDGRGH
jgi:hypothetical protein